MLDNLMLIKGLEFLKELDKNLICVERDLENNMPSSALREVKQIRSKLADIINSVLGVNSEPNEKEIKIGNPEDIFNGNANELDDFLCDVLKDNHREFSKLLLMSSDSFHFCRIINAVYPEWKDKEILEFLKENFNFQIVSCHDEEKSVKLIIQYVLESYKDFGAKVLK